MSHFYTTHAPRSEPAVERTLSNTSDVHSFTLVMGRIVQRRQEWGDLLCLVRRWPVKRFELFVRLKNPPQPFHQLFHGEVKDSLGVMVPPSQWKLTHLTLSFSHSKSFPLPFSWLLNCASSLQDLSHVRVLFDLHFSTIRNINWEKLFSALSSLQIMVLQFTGWPDPVGPEEIQKLPQDPRIVCCSLNSRSIFNAKMWDAHTRGYLGGDNDFWRKAEELRDRQLTYLQCL